MSLATEIAPAHVPVRPIAVVGIVTGLLGAAAAGLLLAWDPQVPDERLSYPFTSETFVWVQVSFFVHHLPLVALIGALWWSGATGRSRLAAIGVAGAAVGMAGLAVMELVTATYSDADYPSDETAPLDIGYGVTSTMIGLFLVLAGIAVLRARIWADWTRWVPLALGVWVFVPMTPGLLAGFTAGRLVIAGWMLGFAVLGWALLRRPEPASLSSSVPHARAAGR